MDSLSKLTVAIGALLSALVLYLWAVDYIDLVPQRVDGILPRPSSKRHL
jgi:hypothetical protein